MVGAQRITAATVSQRRTWSRSTRQQQHRSDASGSTVTPCLQERGTRGRYIAATTRAPRSPRSPHFCKRVGPAAAASQPRLERSALQPRLERSDTRGAAARGSNNIAATPLAARSPLVFKESGTRCSYIAATPRAPRSPRSPLLCVGHEWDTPQRHHSRDWSAAHRNRDWSVAHYNRDWSAAHNSRDRSAAHRSRDLRSSASPQLRLGCHVYVTRTPDYVYSYTTRVRSHYACTIVATLSS
jgi:hypothetical protein